MTRVRWMLYRVQRFTEKHEALMDVIAFVGIAVLSVLLYVLASCQHITWIQGVHN